MIALLVAAALAQAEVDPRDAEIFGEEPADPREEPVQSPDTAPRDYEAELAERVFGQNDTTDIGGLFYLRLEWLVRDDERASGSDWSSPNLLDVFIDSRPNDRVRGFARGRVRHDFTISEGEIDAFGRELEQSEVLLDQLWLKLDIAQAVFLTAGRQPIRWGSGRFWNPTDFMNPVVRNPLAVLDERIGVSMLKLHVPVESLGWNFYAIANIEEADSPEETVGALRAEIVLGQSELALSFAKGQDAPWQLGADISAGVGLFDVHGEVGLQHGVTTEFFRCCGSVDPEVVILDPSRAPQTFTREDDWILQATFGADIAIRYSDEDNVVFGAEYFFNDAGYASDRMLAAVMLSGTFRPLYFGRHYGGLYAMLAAPGSWNDTTFIATLLSNLSDGSNVARLDYRVQVLTYLFVDAYSSYFFGATGELRSDVHIEPVRPAVIDFVEQERQLTAEERRFLENGVDLNPPLYQLGIGLRAAF